ncbi:MAG: hypothetical protein QXI18_02940 [Nitrososphaerota archaeon]
MARRPKGIGVRFCEVPLDDQLKIYQFAMKEATKMQKIKYHELSRLIELNFGVHVWPATIRDWIVKGKHPLRHPKHGLSTKAERRPPDGEIIPDFLGLIYSDLHFHRVGNTLWLSLTTTYDAWAEAVASRFSVYGHVSIRPVLSADTPEWRTSIYLDARSWNDAFISPMRLPRHDAIRFLARAVDGDGWISLNASQARSKRPTFAINISKSYPNNAYMLKEVISSVGWHVSVISRFKREGHHLNGRIFESKRREYFLSIYRKDEVDEFLRSVTMLHPFKEVRRRWALKILDEEMSRDQALKIWRSLHIAEKIAKTRSQLRAVDQLMATYASEGRREKLEKLIAIKEALSSKLSSLKPLLERLTRDVDGPLPYTSFSLPNSRVTITPRSSSAGSCTCPTAPSAS